MALRAASLLLCVSATFAVADYDPSAYPAYETCALCHGLFGVAHIGKFPNLGAQKPQYIENQIRAFLSGERTNDGGQMSAIVTELQPEDIPIVVEWFATQEAPDPYPEDGTEFGAALFLDLGCVGCHDNKLEGKPDIPFLTAQHPAYLAKQMTDFREKRRDVAALPGMHTELLSLPDQNIGEIARYLAAEARP